MLSLRPWWKDHGTANTARRRRGEALFALAVALVAIVQGLSQTPAWALIENRAFDYLSTIGQPARPADAAVVVAIDEPSFAELGLRWPWPRSMHARLVEALRAAGARAIGLDIIFSEPSEESQDAALEAALGPDVVLAGDDTFVDADQAMQHIRVEPLPRFTARGAAIGIAAIAPDADGILRRIPAYPDGFAAMVLKAAGKVFDIPAGRLIQAPAEPRAHETVSYYQALDPAAFLPADFFRGRTVLVGVSLQNAPSLEKGGADVHATSTTVRTGRLVAGIEIQATILDNLAHALAIERASFWTALASVTAGAVLAALLAWRRTGWRTLAAVLAGVVAIGAASYFLLTFGRVFVPPLAPALALVLVAGGQGGLDFAAERRMRRGVTRAFSQYLSPALVQRLARDPSQLRLGGEVRTLTVLFCDIRGFTTIAESMKDDPERLTQLVNRLLTPLSDVVMAHGGTIDKYIGDCLMAFWNAPLDDPRHAEHAVQAALAMIGAVGRVNAELAQEAAVDSAPAASLKVGIGINTGQCVVGNFGSEQRFDYSALGDAVNLASRLESASKELGVQIVIGETTAALAGETVALRPLREIHVKGREAATLVFTPAASPL